MAALPCACCFLSRIDFEDACRDYPEAAALAQRIGRDRFQAVWARMEAVERFEMMDEDGNSLVSKDEVREFLNFMKVRDVDEGDIDEIFAKIKLVFVGLCRLERKRGGRRRRRSRSDKSVRMVRRYPKKKKNVHETSKG